MIIYKKWLLNTFMITIISFATVAGFNYKIDAAGIFSGDTCLSNAAKAVANGNIVAGLGDEAFDDRLFQILLIKQITKQVDIISLGSSRTKELRAQYLNNPNLVFYNHSLNGSSFQDYIAIIGAYKKIKGYIPNQIIIGMDPWIFNENSGRNRWKNISEYYDYISDNIFLKQHTTNTSITLLKKIQQLFNYDYTLTNIKYAYRRYKKKDNGYYIVKTLDADDYLREPDGSIHYPLSVGHPSEEKLYTLSKNYALGNVYSLENYHKLSFLNEFNAFMKYLKKENIKVTIFLPPYNPIPYDILQKQKKYKIDEVEKYLKAYAEENNLQILGSYNPHNLNLVMTDFFDGMHLKDKSIKNIFKKFNSK